MPVIRPVAAIATRVQNRRMREKQDCTHLTTEKTAAGVETEKQPSKMASMKTSAMLQAAPSISKTASLADQITTHLSMRELDAILHPEKHMDGIPEEPEDRSAEVRLNFAMGFVICANALTMGLEIEFSDDSASFEDRLSWFLVESAFITIFLLEIFFRMYLEGRAWLGSWWNYLDVTIVTLALLEQWVLPLIRSSISSVAGDLSMLTILRVARLVRLLRVVRLFRMFRGLYLMAMAFRQAMTSMGWVCFIIASGIYVCSVFTTTVIGHSKDLENVEIGEMGDSAADRFGTVPRSIYSLFELMTLEGWHRVGRPLVMRKPVLILFLFSYIMIFTFGLLNMVVAVVVDKTLQANQQMAMEDQVERQKELRREMLAVKDYFVPNRLNAQGYISLPEFKMAVESCSEVRHLLEDISVPLDQPEVIYEAMDRHDRGEISIADMLHWFAHYKECHHPLFWRSAHIEAMARGLQARSCRLHESLEASNREQATLEQTVQTLHMRVDAVVGRQLAQASQLQEMDCCIEELQGLVVRLGQQSSRPSERLGSPGPSSPCEKTLELA
eukprot:TRINITY_DN36252_c0_g1_i1.p1 TRINITY_DN36252_c0_g1~~TRINITY_DN36252_c0_g1_i1.p1  ORF type:complete len:557 (-),score=126.16 TRINITY_DN36252_c0_g1_i1:158-1828(-)